MPWEENLKGKGVTAVLKRTLKTGQSQTKPMREQQLGNF